MRASCSSAASFVSRPPDRLHRRRPDRRRPPRRPPKRHPYPQRQHPPRRARCSHRRRRRRPCRPCRRHCRPGWPRRHHRRRRPHRRRRRPHRSSSSLPTTVVRRVLCRSSRWPRRCGACAAVLAMTLLTTATTRIMAALTTATLYFLPGAGQVLLRGGGARDTQGERPQGTGHVTWLSPHHSLRYRSTPLGARPQGRAPRRAPPHATRRSRRAWKQ